MDYYMCIDTIIYIGREYRPAGIQCPIHLHVGTYHLVIIRARLLYAYMENEQSIGNEEVREGLLNTGDTESESNRRRGMGYMNKPII